METFPGGTGLTRLQVYPWTAADGLAGGSPHLHTASTESYVVLGGHGRVQTLSLAGLTEHELSVGDVLWFTPGTVHRLVNDSGDLDILAVMANAGLPEHGDAVLTFPDADLADPDRYRRAAALPTGEAAVREEAVRRRRDHALAGYQELITAGRPGFERFLQRAAHLVRGRTDQWRDLVKSGPAVAVDDTLAQLDSLTAGDPGAMRSPVTRRGETLTALGMCGHLQTWQLRPDPDEPGRPVS
ncbi:cupin domain-containing protein [Propionibacteriaceae bacterium Y2011]|uniref:cupin domain-containing protein n=1 Tax=Microlunatus sp. Y2014 TaxID=3418488 RepID=UPI003B4FF50C